MKLRKHLSSLLAVVLAAGLLAAPAAAAESTAAAESAVPAAPASAAESTTVTAFAGQQVSAPTNLALTAVPSASYTPEWNNIDGVNDGIGYNVDGRLDEMWGTWDGERPQQNWLQYSWTEPVTISKSVITFWTDAAAGTGDNVAEPQSWKAQYRLGASDPWVDLPNASAYGTARTGVNETTFTPVTAKEIRATFNGYPNTATPPQYSAVSVTEWEIWGEPAAVEPEEPEEPVTGEPIAVDEVHVRTTPTAMPTLPAKVWVMMPNGKRQERAVTWAAVAPAQIAAAGSVAVAGVIAETAVAASATIWVRATPSPEVASVEDVSGLTVVGVAPQLPTTVIAVYADGSKDSSLPVTWAPIPASDYAAEGFFIAGGVVAGIAIAAAAFVFVDKAPANPGGDGEAPVVTITTSPEPGAAGWITEDVVATTTASDNIDTTPSIEVSVDGGAWQPYTAPVTVSSQGIHSVNARATDDAGNVSITKFADFKIDSVDPVTQLSTQDNPLSVTFTLFTVDVGSGPDRIQYSVGDGFWATYTAKFTVQMLPGPQTLTFASTDKAGNEEVRKTYIIPGLEPVLADSTTTISVPSAAVASPANVPVTVSVASTGAVDGAEVTLFNGETSIGTGTLASGSAVILLTAPPVGSYELTAKFAGNTTTKSSVSAVTDLSVYFADAPPSSRFYDEVQWLIDSGITTGFADGTFRPATNVSRLAMATFLYRLVHDGADAPACTVKPFSDVPATNAACGEIAWLSGQGVIKGYSDGTFRPNASVARDATAAFMYRLAHPGQANLPTCTTKPFPDVSVASPFCGVITWLAEAEVTQGYADGGFHPSAAVARDAMAAFLYRFSNLPS